MPLYDYVCKACGHTAEHLNKIADRKKQRCDKCGELMSPQICVGRYIPFHEGWYPNIQVKPMYISSKRQLRDECRKRGLTSNYAEEG